MKKWSIIYCSIVLFLGACTFEEEEVDPVPPPTRSSSEVTLKIIFEDAGGGSPSTRAVSEAEENTIKTLDVLVFTHRTTGTGLLDDLYAYKLAAGEGTSNPVESTSDDLVKKVTLPFRSLPQKLRIVLLANLPQDLRTSVIDNLGDSDVGVTTANDIFSDLIFSGSPWASEPNTSSFTPFPMFGEMPDSISVNHDALHPTSEYTGPTDSDGHYVINMTRAVAKINVGVDIHNSLGGATGYGTNFLIDSVYVCNSSEKGDVYPYVTKPAGRVDHKVYKFPGSGATKLERAIYVPESDKWSGVDPKPAFLVIAAKYRKGGGVLTSDPNRYYRIDFTEDAEFIPLVRNHTYPINILTIKTEGYASLAEAKDAPPSTVNLDLAIDGGANINDISVYENQYLLGISVNEVIFDWEGNYIGGSGGAAFPVSVYSTYNGQVKWSAVSSAPTYFDVDPDSDTKLSIKALKKNYAEEITESITLKAGLLTKYIKVRQLGGANSVVLKFPDNQNTAEVNLSPINFVMRARGYSIFNGKSIGDFKDSVIWQEKGTNITFDASLSTNAGDGSLGQQYITVKATTTGAKYANAVVALVWQSNGPVMVGGEDFEIVWSWHIWAMPSDGNVNQDYHDPNRLLLMNTVLGKGVGVDPGVHQGLYYQWGRKDPFYRPDNTSHKPDSIFDYNDTGTYTDKEIANNLTNSILYPTTFFKGSSGSDYDLLLKGDQNQDLWKPGEKTYYDPCPEGWRVPPSYADLELSPWKNEGVAFVPSRNSKGFIPSAYNEGSSQSNAYLWTSSAEVNGIYVSGSSSGYLHGQKISRAAGLSVRCVKELSRQY